jgi:hypothetical protein
MPFTESFKIAIPPGREWVVNILMAGFYQRKMGIELTKEHGVFLRS